MISNKNCSYWFRICWPAVARLFATKYPVVGFDINQSRINGLLSGTDSFEISDEVLQAVLLDKNPCYDDSVSKFKKNELTNNQINGLYCSAALSDIADCNYYIITVPTQLIKITVRI
jgi:UDP-N-acetyl-D-galactosamine dehydrogenase